MTHSINGRTINPIGLGCMSLSWAYGTPPADADGERLLHKALDLGYDHLDTARIYGLGHNETLIGRALKSRRGEFVLASKTGIIVDGERRRIEIVSPANKHNRSAVEDFSDTVPSEFRKRAVVSAWVLRSDAA